RTESLLVDPRRQHPHSRGGERLDRTLVPGFLDRNEVTGPQHGGRQFDNGGGGSARGQHRGCPDVETTVSQQVCGKRRPIVTEPCLVCAGQWRVVRGSAPCPPPGGLIDPRNPWGPQGEIDQVVGLVVEFRTRFAFATIRRW